MAKPKAKVDIEQMIRHLDFPHLRSKKGAWLQTGPAPLNSAGASFDRLCHYGRKLRELGMSDADIADMFKNLYWDAVTEYKLNPKPKS